MVPGSVFQFLVTTGDCSDAFSISLFQNSFWCPTSNLSSDNSPVLQVVKCAQGIWNVLYCRAPSTQPSYSENLLSLFCSFAFFASAVRPPAPFPQLSKSHDGFPHILYNCSPKVSLGILFIVGVLISGRLTLLSPWRSARKPSFSAIKHSMKNSNSLDSCQIAEGYCQRLWRTCFLLRQQVKRPAFFRFTLFKRDSVCPTSLPLTTKAQLPLPPPWSSPSMWCPSFLNLCSKPLIFSRPLPTFPFLWFSC